MGPPGSKGPSERDPSHGHLVGGLLHSGGGPGKPTSSNAGRASRADLTDPEADDTARP